MSWKCISKALRFLQITAEYQDCPFFTAFLTIKTLSQNISITLSQISLKLHERRGGYWRKKLLQTILEEQFPVLRNTVASEIGNSVISLLWQLRCHCNLDHNKFSSLSNTTVVAIFPNLCLWRRSLFSNLRGIDPEKLYRATLKRNFATASVGGWKTKLWCYRLIWITHLATIERPWIKKLTGILSESPLSARIKDGLSNGGAQLRWIHGKMRKNK